MHKKQESTTQHHHFIMGVRRRGKEEGGRGYDMVGNPSFSQQHYLPHFLINVNTQQAFSLSKVSPLSLSLISAYRGDYLQQRGSSVLLYWPSIYQLMDALRIAGPPPPRPPDGEGGSSLYDVVRLNWFDPIMDQLLRRAIKTGSQYHLVVRFD